MLRFPHPSTPSGPRRARCPEKIKDLGARLALPECREKLKKVDHVAVVGGGFAGLMAARRLVQQGIKVTLYEARKEVGGRVLSNPNFSNGRITEEGAELIGSFHTKWLELAREFGLAMISRMDPDLYEQECLDVRLRLEKDKFVSMKQFWDLTKSMDEKVLRPLSDFAEKKIGDPSRPWLQGSLQQYDNMSVTHAFENFDKVLNDPQYSPIPRNGLLWKMLEFKLVNDEVAPLDEMNFLGLLCKVRAGQGKRCVEDDHAPSCIKDGYWEELEIFRCADGCQTLANKVADKIQTKQYGPEPAKVFRNVAITRIELSSREGVRLWYKDTRDNKFVDEKAPPKPIPGLFSYVILAIPPSVWSPPALKITAGNTFRAKDRKDVDPADAKEIGQMHMNDAVKYFSDVEKRFWIKERPNPSRNRGSAPYGGSFLIGQVWEGTDNQTRTGNQGIVLSVFAGPVSPTWRAPTRKDFEEELPKLYSGYTGNLIKREGNPLLSDWPNVPFIRAGYWSPKPKDIWKVGEKLTKPYHDRLFFAGEHTQMDFFGYMEGALRSGERAAETLMLHACGLREETAPKPEGPVRVARAAPAREIAALGREVATPFRKPATTGDRGEGESPFLDRELFVAGVEQEQESRVAALVAESPYVRGLDELRSEEAAPDELEDEDELETEDAREEMEDEERTSQPDQEEDEFLGEEGAPGRNDESKLEPA
jgi:monoamine oxidase